MVVGLSVLCVCWVCVMCVVFMLGMVVSVSGGVVVGFGVLWLDYSVICGVIVWYIVVGMLSIMCSFLMLVNGLCCGL